jgi:hypothetical protein
LRSTLYRDTNILPLNTFIGRLGRIAANTKGDELRKKHNNYVDVLKNIFENTELAFSTGGEPFVDAQKFALRQISLYLVAFFDAIIELDDINKSLGSLFAQHALIDCTKQLQFAIIQAQPKLSQTPPARQPSGPYEKLPPGALKDPVVYEKLGPSQQNPYGQIPE